MGAFLETRSYSPELEANIFYCFNNNFLAHYHIDVEMVYVCEGSILIGVNKETKVLNKGEMAIFSSTDIHYYDSENRSSSIVVLIFRPDIVGCPAGWPENANFASAFIDSSIMNKLDNSVKMKLRSIFYEISEEFRSERPFFEQYIKGKIIELSSLCLRHFPTCNKTLTDKPKKIPDIPKIQYIIDYIEKNYNSDLDLKTISNIANLSPYYFSRLFKKFTGLTFKKYLTIIRIDKAQKLIKSTPKSMLDISMDCGYNCVRTFNRDFKKVKGYAPTKEKWLYPMSEGSVH
ncbi:AraC family transcriptional regulator [Clostridium oryzae]|uniref:Bifunctional transcriptional activator/DNA repair enzyme AdaA n=1 Tax=Clostridium oryzae TaxID=1450648 RepID=A0A1V4I889_9CLOT|nr:AraC family transcriptional regulator [Clostridium oryzae]OPJ56181.1 bifunctional transcriptional activator/DNA repair enzyme AdaA [Clostridium oryzae]